MLHVVCCKLSQVVSRDEHVHMIRTQKYFHSQGFYTCTYHKLTPITYQTTRKENATNACIQTHTIYGKVTRDHTACIHIQHNHPQRQRFASLACSIAAALTGNRSNPKYAPEGRKYTVLRTSVNFTNESHSSQACSTRYVGEWQVVHFENFSTRSPLDLLLAQAKLE